MKSPKGQWLLHLGMTFCLAWVAAGAEEIYEAAQTLAFPAIRTDQQRMIFGFVNILVASIPLGAFIRGIYG